MQIERNAFPETESFNLIDIKDILIFQMSFCVERKQ